ncbi:prolyl aminopeptidase [Crenobacter cavernae]|uniref:Proline iminopeptidase n=1 Tax=Crenobacter cavernae TaxID=2290923 RepID=A0A345YA78_9NEIS|nr:prolyl aminopeptidase [Crenobacter cavernae]AXK40830.1 prolyl aminopeptidase [Crenobacter cavernae]
MPLFPPIKPFADGLIDVGDGHRLYWEQVGRADGAPALFLHGGPGAGCSERHRQLFDPAHYRAVLFDQRGAGRSLPFGELSANSTPHLIADIEALRVHLGIERWLVVGGSWGSTLALAYAQTHPERVKGLILRGVFLGRDSEVDWFMHRMGDFQPEAREAFLSIIPEAEHVDLLSAYYARLTSPSREVRVAAARVWAGFEDACATLLPQPASQGADAVAYSIARLEAHYFVHRLFLADAPLLDNMAKIAHLPAVVVQGRYDLVCPPVSAWELAQAWPKAELVVVPDAGHSLWEPGILDATLAALERFKALS